MTRPEAIDAYLAGPGQLRDAIRGMTPEQLDARPIATLSLEAQERHERRERVYREDRAGPRAATAARRAPSPQVGSSEARPNTFKAISIKRWVCRLLSPASIDLRGGLLAAEAARSIRWTFQRLVQVAPHRLQIAQRHFDLVEGNLDPR